MAQLDKMLSFARENYIPVMLDDTKKLLQQLTTENQPKKILEIGTAIGYSGIVMLTSSPEAQLNTIEMDEKSAEMARQNFIQAGVYDRVNLFVGDAKEIVTQLTGKYDFIFLDGPKGQYDCFLPYLIDVLEVGGLLVCDNVLYKGLVEHVPEHRHKHITIARNLNRFLDDLNNDNRLTTRLHRTGDGVTVSRRIK
ncbi:MAG TPA: O-methyltransferase [Candidatus Limihabitans stercoravium]|nr:O-methyltransferase [Candidatus Limihabitans stercoravium]